MNTPLSTPKRVAILSLGTELTTGQTQDTNARWLAEELTFEGCYVSGVEVLPDNLADIIAAVERRAGQNDVLLVTGGLGPTDDDLTRRAIADALGAELAIHEESLDSIRRFFAARDREMPENNRVQAMIPVGARPIPNPRGTAPGIAATLGETAIFAMPGVPGEMRQMFDASVRASVRVEDARHTVRRIVTTYGTTESELGQTIADLMTRGRNPDVGTTAKGGVIRVRIHAHGASDEDARRRLDADVATIQERLGDTVIGLDDVGLPEAVGDLLSRHGMTLATAESCTGGLVAKMLTDVSGASAWFGHGFVTYANEAKMQQLGVTAASLDEHGAVSEQVAREMAVGCRRASGASIAISLTGVAGPTGGTPEKPVGLVYLGLADDRGEFVTAIRCGSDLPRTSVRVRAANAALNLVRRRLLKRKG